MCVITKHAKDRLQERLGVSKKNCKKVAERAFLRGITHAETKGSLNRYINGLYLREEKANQIRLFGDKIFLFRNGTLITVLQTPRQYMKIVRKLFEKRKDDGNDKTAEGK